VDEARGLIDIHTDSETAKVAQIRANPMVSIMVWRADMEMQIRLTGRAQILLGAAAASLWRDVPLGARPNYGVTPAPGSKIPAPGAFSREADSARFAVLRVSIEAIDAVILAQPQHRRAVFERADDWGGAWLAP
jgi:pyridoxamine 5'-phosphate oxidase